jgi:hypothetical protein
MSMRFKMAADNLPAALSISEGSGPLAIGAMLGHLARARSARGGDR